MNKPLNSEKQLKQYNFQKSKRNFFVKSLDKCKNGFSGLKNFNDKQYITPKNNQLLENFSLKNNSDLNKKTENTSNSLRNTQQSTVNFSSSKIRSYYNESSETKETINKVKDSTEFFKEVLNKKNVVSNDNHQQKNKEHIEQQNNKKNEIIDFSKIKKIRTKNKLKHL